MEKSNPTLSEFSPVIPYQRQLINDIRQNFDYSLGKHEVLLSGAIGSAKSTVAAHLALTHVLSFKGARCLLGRRSLPDAKRTIFSKVLDHIPIEYIEGVHYWVNSTQASIYFINGSEIISGSWADKRYLKFRSLDLSAAIFEELVENENDDVQAYTEIKMRIGRLPHIKENWIISCTNPGGTDSYWYKYFIESENKTKHVYYSVTSDNPFLPKSYIDSLKSDLDPKMVERMIYGKWIDIAGETIYYQYNREIHYRKDQYKINLQYPIHFSFDFNIGHGKPLSVVFFQYIDDCFHFFDQVVIEGLRTHEAMQEAHERGLFNYQVPFYYLHGDASGKNQSTNSNKNNYEIITQFLDENRIKYKYGVLKSNPPIKSRHNVMNAYLMNSYGQVRMYVYSSCPKGAEALQLTKLKDGGSYIEDDSKDFQHIGTAMGYGVYYLYLLKQMGESKTIKL